jgi:hypothetical protein
MESLDKLYSLFVEQQFIRSLCVINLSRHENGAYNGTESEWEILC